MATALSPRRLTHSLSAIAKPEAAQPALYPMAALLWDQSQDLARAALESDYIQGIGKGTLKPDAYGQYSVQDVAYCHYGLEDWRAAADRATHAGLKTFAEARVKSWVKSTKEIFDAWHIQDPSAVKLCAAAQDYADFESEVARTYDPIYAAVVMTPCDRLWSWLAQQLAPDAVPTNLYTFWIKENTGDSGARHLERIIDANADLLDESTALEVFRRAMLGEVNFFRSACGQPPWDVFEI